MKGKLTILAAVLASVAVPAFAQTTTGDRNASITTRTATPTPTPYRPRPLTAAEQERQRQASQRRQQSADTGDPDVLLDVPNLSVDEITLEVANLRANVSLDARLANLLKLTAGADVGIERVNLTIRGVKAEVLLKVRLDNVNAIIARTLDTIDKNPQILERLLASVDNTVNTVGNVANTALQPGGVLSQTVNSLGQTVQRTLDSTGSIVERTLNSTGGVLNQRTIGSILDTAATGLSIIGETTNAAGQTVRRLRDASGSIIEVTLDSAGRIVNSRVVQSSVPRR
jgi:hypothetical protein